jgi:hypothetical protein
MPKKKKMFSLGVEVCEAIETYAVAHRLQKSEVIEEAIASLLKETRSAQGLDIPAGEMSEPILRKLDAIKKEMYYVDHNVQVILATLDVYLKDYEDKNGRLQFTDEMSEVVVKAEEYVRFNRKENIKRKNGLPDTL